MAVSRSCCQKSHGTAPFKMCPYTSIVQHNIGTEALFYENTYKYSVGYLHMAYKAASEIGFAQLCYINNSIALSDILDGDYQKALYILDSMLKCYQEDFTLLAIYLNEATCFRKKGLKTKFWESIDKAKKINAKIQNHFPFFLQGKSNYKKHMTALKASTMKRPLAKSTII